MTAFAIFRLPYQQQATVVEQTVGEPLRLSACGLLGGQRGFVLAPFAVNTDQPLLLIRPDVVQTVDVEEWCGRKAVGTFLKERLMLDSSIQGIRDGSNVRSDYAIDFANFHAQLESDHLQKIVLARCSVEERSEEQPPVELFRRACRLYPRLFVALVYTPQSGLWLTATPEILLEGDGTEWRTIALAGTMRLEGDALGGEGEEARWSVKNIQEQRMVSTYITECLEHFSEHIHEEGPRTVRAANLVHLRSDFTFTLLNSARVGELLQALHPTPAVCGLPKRDAFRFIMSNEQTPRLYYSGFQGPLGLDGGTHLYVSLRCMQITASQYRMYAGGGLLKDSVEEQEWNETEAKLETMRQCIATRKM